MEENNLADALRECLADSDGESAVVLVAALGGFWTIRGEHPRILTLLDSVEGLLAHWDPPADAFDATARAACVLVLNTSVAGLPTPVRARALLARHGRHSVDPVTRALQAALEALGDELPGRNAAALELLADHPDRLVAMLGLQWQSHYLENLGEVEAATSSGERSRALWRPEDGVWSRALLDTHLAGLYAQLGRLDLARRRAEDGLGVLDALEAHDDAIQLRAVVAAAALAEGDIDRAEALLEQMTSIATPGLWGAIIWLGVTRAEVALARGRVSEGLALYDRAVVQVRDLRFPGIPMDPGTEPWTLYIESVTAAAHAWHGAPDEAGSGLRDLVAAKLPVVIAADQPGIDYPVAGCMLFALGIWSLLRDDEPETGVECLALARRFGYNLYSAAMSWDRVVALAERSAPGRLEQVLAGYGERRGADLLEEARAAGAGLL